MVRPRGAAAGGDVDAFPASELAQQGRDRRSPPGCLRASPRSRKKRNPREAESVPHRDSTQHADRPHPPQPGRPHRRGERSRRTEHRLRSTRPRPHGHRARRAAPPRSRDQPVAAARERGGVVAPRRRPLPPRNRRAHGRQREHRFRSHYRGHARARRHLSRRSRRIAERKMNDINATASRFLERRDLGQWTDADQAELDAWLNESAAHCAAFWRLEAVWQDADRLSALRSFKPQTAKSEPRRDIWPILRRAVAATVVIAAAGTAGALYLLQPQGERYATPMGGREVITLFDGSQVELNTDTQIRIAPGKRMAWVEKGEAYFQIKHDAA